MNNRGLKTTIILFLILVVPAVGYLLLRTGTNHFKPLPIFGERYEEAGDTVYHTVGDFAFINQYGDTVSSNSLKGNIKIVNFFFTDCKTICPKMSSQLERVQKKTQTVDNIVILSHTVNPESDSVPVLMKYAEMHGAMKNKWHFLTGDKKELYRIAREGYLVNALQGDGGPNDFIHTEMFVLIDQNQRIRGFYDGTSAGAVDTLIDELKVLLKEEIAGPKKSRK
ncbi:MAG: SCO family protein [Sphingobacteriales bacterium]|nr:SCO family protein [Sphingobacteriales bacterium]